MISESWLVPALSVVPILTAFVVLAVRGFDGRRLEALPAWLGAVACLAVTVVAGVATALVVDRGSSRPRLEVDAQWIPALGVRAHLGLDGVSAPLVLLTSALGVLVCVHLALTARSLDTGRRLVGCVLLVVGSANATFTALDLVLFFVAFEGVLIPMWFVIAVWGDDRQSAAKPYPGAKPLGGEAARRDAAGRFVLYTATGSALMLLGILLVVLKTGSSDLVALATDPSSLPGGTLSQATQFTAALLIVAGLAVKAPMWPLHTWLPPAHTIAPTAGSVLLAGVLLKLGTYGLVRVAVPVLPDGFRELAPWLGVLGAVGVVWAGLACLVERDLKRLVAFSSVAHMGFVLLGIASMSPVGMQGALYANIAHGVVSALLFFVVGALKDRTHSADLGEIGPGLRDRVPRLGWLLALGAVAGIGLPGLAVFWGELLAVAGAWQSGADDGALGALGRPLAVVAAVGTVIAAAYWLRVLREIWMGETDPQRARLPDASRGDTLTVAPLALATVALGLVPGPLLALTSSAARGLLQLVGAP
ncbi:NuoM family protein [Spongisporangium articulatum]|uniref:NuoM family protein n=1 Tax=Spongisporangium articulatum TaxID=3362603 RepID=A0ABW8ANU9_9ACTN